ncbi:MAG TPA: hypothetical protein PK967_11900 [Candidatus Hydrogenedentes bacterium]|nr:hypothetical protein [Candidatus Hydrogenedentota bacterium]
MMTKEQIGTLRVMAAVLWRCLVMAAGLLLFWFLLLVAAGDFTYGQHSRWFSMTRHEFDLLVYGFMGLFKIGAITFFLFPWLAIQWIIRSAGKNDGM